MQSTCDTTIGSIVAKNFKTAAVFKKLNIDFYFKGNLTVAEVCDSNKLPFKDVEEKLMESLRDPGRPGVDYNSWPITNLLSYIEDVLHRYVGEKIFQLQLWIDRCRKVQGEEYPHLAEVQQMFALMSGELLVHLMMEEKVLFPAIRAMVARKATAKQSWQSQELPDFRSLLQEHETIGGYLHRLSDLTNGYHPPKDAPGLYELCCANLKEFEEDYLFHIHLENNIMLPKVLRQMSVTATSQDQKINNLAIHTTRQIV